MFKSLPTQIAAITAAFKPRAVTQNLRFLGWFGVFLAGLILLFTILFHEIMQWEGRDYSWVTGLYWTLVTMSTLGFGDVTFHSDAGKVFSIVVLVSGMLLLLALLPFMFIEFFYSPFVKSQQEARAPRSVPDTLRGHVIFTHLDPVADSLIRKLRNHGTPYVLAVKEVDQALSLHDQGYTVVVTNLEQPAGFARCGFERASLLAATGNDFENTSIVFTARQLSPDLLIVATADSHDSIDVLQLAGASHVIQLGELLGQALARRTVATDAQAHVIGSFSNLRIAEGMAAGTPLQGKTLAETRLRELAGVNVIGLWQRGVFREPSPEVRLSPDTLMLLAGTDSQIETYNALFCIYHQATDPCVIIGADRVGKAVARAFDQLDLKYRILDKDPEKLVGLEHGIQGNAADHATLLRAGLDLAPAVIITTREDDVNIYLTIYCRKLRPDIQIVARANVEGNVARLHSAGADMVMSYASMGSNMLFNLLRDQRTLLVAEGLNIFRTATPRSLEGCTIADSRIREQTGCSVVATRTNGVLDVNPPPGTVLQVDQELLLIGTHQAEERFLDLHGRA